MMHDLKIPVDHKDEPPLERIQIQGLLSPEAVYLEGTGALLIEAADLVRMLVRRRISNPDSYSQAYPDAPSKLKPITREEIHARLSEVIPGDRMAELRIEVSSMLTD